MVRTRGANTVVEDSVEWAVLFFFWAGDHMCSSSNTFPRRQALAHAEPGTVLKPCVRL